MNQSLINREIIGRYIGQPGQLPPALREQIERDWANEPVQLYAMADLDAGLRLSESWVALGPTRIALARPGRNGDWDVRTIHREHIQAVQESPGLSANTLVLLGAPDEPPLAVARYTQRQRGAFENIRFVLDEAIAGRTVTSEDADRVYADAVARPIRDAQALVSRRRAAVTLRLLKYLAPYRKQVMFGMGAAAVITMVSLVPPYLAGYVIDRVVRPVQAGTMSREAGVAIAWLAVATMVLVYAVRQTAAHLRLRLMSVLGELVARDLRSELYEHIQKLSLSFFSRKKTGSLITRVDVGYRSPLGLRRVRDRGRVAVDDHAHWSQHGAVDAGLAAWSRHDDPGAAAVLVHLSAWRTDEPRVPARVAQMVARDGRVVRHDSWYQGGEGVQPGSAGDRAFRRAE
jgi:hypothetical protein